jgi:aldehyde:ferredoxin oxidoreductase
MHDPRFSPWFGKTYQYDPTPGRHVKGGLGTFDFRSTPEVKYNYEGRGPMDLGMVCHTEVVNTAGLCLFSGFATPPGTVFKYFKAVTGWDFGQEQVLSTGMRILNMRYAFNLREGQNPDDAENKLPDRSAGKPPQTVGPLAGVEIDQASMRRQFLEGMNWSQETLIPTRESLEKQGGMEDVIRDLYR